MYTGDDLLHTDSEDSEDESLLPSSSQHFRDLLKRASECDQILTDCEENEVDGQDGATSSGHVSVMDPDSLHGYSLLYYNDLGVFPRIEAGASISKVIFSDQAFI